MKTITRSIIVLLALMFAALSGACTAQVGPRPEPVACSLVETDSLCSGITRLVVYCDRAIESRSDVEDVVGPALPCTHSATDERAACCYLPGAVPPEAARGGGL